MPVRCDCPADHGLPLGRRVARLRLEACVQVQQIVQAEAVLAPLLEHACVHQHAEQPVRLLDRQVGGCRDHGPVEVCARQQPDRPVQPRGVRRQRLVRQVERRPDRHVLHRQRDRQAAAELDQRTRRRPLGIYPLGSYEPREQLDRGGLPQRSERQQCRPGSQQPAEPPAAGHDHHSVARAWQERAHLRGGGGVVQQDEHPPARRERAVQGGLLVQRAGNALRGDSQHPQELAKDLARRLRPSAP